MKKLIRRLLLLAALLLALSCTAVAIENYQVRSKSELYGVLSEQLENRVTNFTVTYGGDYLDLLDRLKNPNVAALLRGMAASQPNTDGSGPDYNELNVKDASAGLLDGVLYFQFSYLTTQEQEQELDASCAQILAGLALGGETDAVKTRLIYEYIGTHFVYDDTLKTYSAWEGLKTGSMVCQGYSLLLYKLLWQAGIPNRIVVGTGIDEAHSWNMVRLDGSWYDLDVTWDAASRPGEAMRWVYFLRAERNFLGHKRADEFSAPAFLALCPSARQDYPTPRVAVSVSGDSVQSLILRLGVPVQLSVSVPGGAAYTLVSTDPAVVSVDENGLLTAHRLGSCSIFIRTADRAVIPGMLNLRTVDLSKASAWAFGRVTDYYLSGLLPVSYCADFQKELTRGELAELLFSLFSAKTGIASLDAAVPFTDIQGTEHESAIVICTALGLFSGTGEDTFSPDAPVTREQAAKLLVRAAELLSRTALSRTGTPSCSDAADVSAWAAPYVAASYAEGLLRGAADGRFMPAAHLTREQVIVMLDRLAQWADAKAAA